MIAVEKTLIFVAFLALFAVLAIGLMDAPLSIGAILALSTAASVAAAILLKRHMAPAMIILYVTNAVLLAFKGGMTGIYVAVFLLIPLLIFLRDSKRLRAREVSESATSTT